MQNNSANKKKLMPHKALSIQPLSNDNQQDAFANLEHYQQALRDELKAAQENVISSDDGWDCVMEASIESFPCSDPPAWTNVHASTRV